MARLADGFGGGFDDGQEVEGTEGRGGGGGGGVVAKPIGALEITDDGTRFVRFDDRTRVVGLLLLGLALGWVLRTVTD